MGLRRDPIISAPFNDLALRSPQILDRSRSPFQHVRRAAAILMPLLALACAACPGGGPAPPPRTNLLVVTVDSLRADHLGCAGFPAAQTPAIDALAARGARFTSAWTPVPEATPAAASLMTGLLGWRDGQA